ncbi:serine hydrolase domain-containing protein [Nonomuraea sp. NPDC050547]|uniref:serine hydrolase domain-containing protein n=1 Tax=unclassified Nonomuraea TaxID=2593643 RepID=UPI00379FAC93
MTIFKAGLLLSAVVMTATALASPAEAAHDRADVRRSLERAVEGGAPGMVAEIRDHRGRWFGSAGVADLKTGEERRSGERFRIGSTTKTFTALLVLQLAAEGSLSLDDSVDTWLPGLVRGNGYDGREITIRQLLNHTSGIFNYGNDAELMKTAVGAAWYEHRFDAYTPAELVKIGLSNPPYFAPGAGFGYSNTNYYLAAMIIERITGRSYGDELERRVLRPLGLSRTYLPGRDTKIRGEHPVHHSTLFSMDADPEIHDATEMNQSFAWAAGGIVSTTGDLQRFFGALLAGKLLPAAQQREMFTTVATQGGPPWIPHTRYGLGVFSQELPGGVTLWGNGGATYGSWTFAMGTRDGGRLLTTQINGDWSGLAPFDDLFTAAFS